MNNKVIILSLCMAILLLLTGTLLAVDYDLNGETVSIVGQATVRTLQDFKEDADGPFAGRLAEVEEKFNCNIELVDTHWSDPEIFFERLMSGESNYDIWGLNQWRFWPLFEAEGLYPLDHIIEEVMGSDPYADYYENAKWRYDEYYNYKGTHYAMTSNEGHGSNMVYFNKELIANEGLPDPYELYKNDEWTWENMWAIAEQVTKDTDDDGENDQWGIHAREWHFPFMNGGEWFIKEDGRYIFNGESEAIIEALSIGQDVFNNEVQKWDTELELFFDGRIAFSWDALFRLAMESEDDPMDYGILPFPKGPHADNYHTANVGISGAGLPLNVEEPEALVALFHDLFRPEDGRALLNNTIRSYAKDEIAKEVLEKSATEFGIGYLNAYPIAGNPMSIISNVYWNGEDPAQATAEVRSEFQQKLDEVMN